jgi:hypothetical protein
VGGGVKLGRQRIILTGLAALVIAILVQIFLPLNWTTAQCGTAEMANPFAAYGTPLPYMMWSGVSSLEYDYVIWTLIFNLVALTALGFAVLSKFPFFGRIWNLAWLFPGAVIGGLLLWVPLFWSVDALGGVNPINMADFRPVGIGVQSYDCTASPYWFPQKKEPPAN